MSIESGIYPSKLSLLKFYLQLSRVRMNYTQITTGHSLPRSLFNRVLEKLMYNRLKSFLDNHNLLYHCQYGFREKCSTHHALIDIVDRIQLIIGKKLFFLVVYSKIPKIRPGAYIFQRPFLRGLFLEGLIYTGKFAFKTRLG